MRVIGVRFEDDGTVVVDWVSEREQSRFGGEGHSTYITTDGQAKNDKLGYYVEELRQDAAELVTWFQRAREDGDM